MLEYALLGARLRWRLTRNRLRKGGSGLFFLGLAASAIFGLVGFGLFATARAGTEVHRASTAILGLTSIVLGWVFMPIVAGGADETVDPTRLALIPLTRRELGAVLVGGAVSGPATLAVLVALCGVIVGYAPAGVGALIVAAIVPCTFLLGLGLARLVGAGLARAQRSRKGRDVAVVVTTLIGVTLWLGTQAIGPALRNADDRTARRLIGIFGRLPTGWPGRGLIAASEGRLAAATGWLVVTATAASVALAGWAAATARLAQGTERVTGLAVSSGSAPLGTAATPWAAAVAREVRYLRRSPSKRVQLLMTTVMGVGFAAIQAMGARGGQNPRIAFLGLVSMVMTSGAGFNLIGWDSASLWVEDLSGGLTIERIRARALGCLPHVIVPGVLGVLTVCVLTGSWQATPLALVETVTIAMLALGIGAFISTVVPMPANDGDNPFAWRSGMGGAGCVTGLWMMLGVVVLGLIAAPTLVPLIIWYDRPWAPLISAAGIGLGAAVYVVGTQRATGRVAQRGPDLIAELSPRSVV